ncbi:MAG: hypothetical protein WA790_06510 [Sulfitobacter sp.]
MGLGYIEDERLKLVPKRYWEDHEFCFYIHDLILHLTKVAEAIGAGTITVSFRDDDDRRSLLEADNPIDWLGATGRTQEEKRAIVNHTCRALFPDMLHFIFSAMRALEKRQFTVALSLFRKPFQEGLPLLALMCGDEDQYFDKLKSDPRGHFDGRKFNSEAKREAIAHAIANCEGMDFADAGALHSILFDYDSEAGLAGLFDKATHLFTRRSGNATEDYNINFIFKDPRDNDIYEHSYRQIAYVLLCIHLFQIELMGRMGFGKAAYRKHLMTTSVGAYEAIFGTGRSRMSQFFNTEFSDLLKCPVCDEQIKLRKFNAGRFFVTEMLKCNHCKQEHHFPASWIFSRGSETEE